LTSFAKTLRRQRSIKIKEVEEGNIQQATDFFEKKVTVKTGK